MQLLKRAFGIAFLAVLPVLCARLGMALASALGCQLDEGNAHPCIAYGIDLGPLLYALFIMFWLAIGTIPLGYFALLGLGGFWLLTHRPSHPWWPFVLLAEGVLASLYFWREPILLWIF